MDDNLEELLKEFGDLPTSTGSTHDRLSSKSAGRSSFPAPQQPLYTKSQLDSSRPSATAAKQTATITLAPANYSSAKQQQQGSIGPPINMQPQQNSTATAVRQPRSSLDDLLDDLEAVGPLSPSTERASAPGLQGPGHHRFPSTSSTAASGGARSGFRCMGGMFLGGSAAPRGRNGSIIGSVTCCDSIRCTKCDFKVVVFDNQAWHTDVDYLFFRNNYPTAGKLAPKLSSQGGACAYCCQCSWRTVQGSEASRIDSYAGDLRWVCAGHAS